MKECNEPGGKQADNKVNYAWFRTLESRGKGEFDPKNSGTEMTNGNGMNCLQNFKEVTKALMGMYPSMVETRDYEVGGVGRSPI